MFALGASFSYTFFVRWNVRTRKAKQRSRDARAMRKSEREREKGNLFISQTHKFVS